MSKIRLNEMGVSDFTPQSIIDEIVIELKSIRSRIVDECKKSGITDLSAKSELNADKITIEYMRPLFDKFSACCGSKKDLLMNIAIYILENCPVKSPLAAITLANKRLQRYDEEMLAIELYREGYTISEVASKLGVSKTQSGIYANLAKDRGINIVRKYAGKIEGKSRFFTLDKTKEIDNLIMSGLCNSEIAWLLNIRPSSKVGCRRGELRRMGMVLPTPNPISSENYEQVSEYLAEERKRIVRQPQKDVPDEDGWNQAYEEQRAFVNVLINNDMPISIILKEVCKKFGDSETPRKAKAHIYFTTQSSIENLIYGSESELSQNKVRYKLDNDNIVYIHSLDGITYKQHKRKLNDFIVNTLVDDKGEVRKFLYEWELIQLNRYILSNVIEEPFNRKNLYRRFIDLSDDLKIVLKKQWNKNHKNKK